MPRLIMIVGLFVVVAATVSRIIESGALNRGNTFRPRGRAWRAKPQRAAGATFLVSRAELAGVRDSFSAEPIDAQRQIRRCPDCQAFYHLDSVRTLERENRGVCVNCPGTHFDPVQVVG